MVRRCLRAREKYVLAVDFRHTQRLSDLAEAQLFGIAETYNRAVAWGQLLNRLKDLLS